jgi:6-hydroxymethylpterin diphosphokinase MptE-like
MIEVFTSRSGLPSIKIQGISLHSPYDPEKEAARFGRETLGTELPSTVVILGEGLAYLSRWTLRTHPSVRILRVFYSMEIFRSCNELFRDSQPADDKDSWHPGLGISIRDFLNARVGELDVDGLRVLEWPPSARAFPELSRAANEALQQCLREANGSLVTTLSMGRLWLRNGVANFLSFDEILRGAPCSAQRAVVIAASGPSLESAAPVLREIRDSVDLWALPSSARFLTSAGLKPDLFIMTDPGYYAISHFHQALPACPVAMPLSAARGIWRLSQLPFLLAQPGQLEEALLPGLAPAFPQIFPHGTVASTALDLARAFTRGPVIFAGLDMCADDVVSHARPNMFERFFHLQSMRTSPYDNSWYRRSADQNASRIPGSARARASLSLRTYAGWLGHQTTGAGVYRLLPSAVALPGMVPLDAASLKELARRMPPCPAGHQLAASPAFLSRTSRAALVSTVIDGWRKSLSAAAKRSTRASGVEVLAEMPVFPLVRQLSTRQLLETRRKARRGDPHGARESAVDLLEECERFLRALVERAVHAA